MLGLPDVATRYGAVQRTVSDLPRASARRWNVLSRPRADIRRMPWVYSRQAAGQDAEQSRGGNIVKFEIVVRKSTEEIARIKGWKKVSDNELTVEEQEQIIPMEALLEKLTGFRFHINQVL